MDDYFDFDKTQKNDYGYVGKGMYFTPNKQHALAYAEREQYKSMWSNVENDINSKAIVLTCFLCLKNPKVVNSISILTNDIAESQKKEISSKITLNLKEKGFDGVIWHRDNCNGCVEGRKHWEYITYNSNQIKLADGSNTTFDAGNPDIRFMAGGDTQKIKNKKYIIFREEYFKHLIAGELGNIRRLSEKNGNKNISDLVIKLSLLHQQQKAYL
jgi:hypothetical protein